MKKTSEKSAGATLEAVRKHPATRVKVAVADIDGVLRGKYIHKDKFFSALDGGFGFCNVVFGWDINDVTYDNTTWTGWHTGYPDAMVELDLATARNIPWDDGVPFFLGNFVDAKGAPLEVCPRQVLKRVLRKATKMGFAPMCGIEYEWFNFRETPQSFAEKHYTNPQPISPGMFGYSMIRMAQSQPFFKALVEELAQFRIPLEGIHTETGPGVFEAAILYADALESADRAILFKQSAKEIGARFGIMPSFMAKWSQQYPGCSGHVHQSLSDGKKNLLYDERDPHKMSAMFKSYLAGQLAVLPELMPMYAPTINSYKRLVDGMWAPVRASWGVDNRTASFRVIPGSSKSTRLETRCPGSDINPYLAVAALIAAGLHGIEKNLKLTAAPQIGEAKDSKTPRLPRTLERATEKFKQSKLAREFFGDTFVDHYTATREWEWRQFQDAVTDWEFRRYFEIV
jgi:glutamine synthetase